MSVAFRPCRAPAAKWKQGLFVDGNATVEAEVSFCGSTNGSNQERSPWGFDDHMKAMSHLAARAV